ncbi:MAG TPA: hypothetical protein VNI77_03910 [Nitrososphaera sp.]|nr:hypothetical protein [Nitrososphaera sp.]
MKYSLILAYLDNSIVAFIGSPAARMAGLALCLCVMQWQYKE